MAEYTIQEIPVSRFTVDPEIQRGLRQLRVDREADRFDENGLGLIEASDRGPGELVIIDGQHRVAFARKARGPEFKVLTKVWTGLNKQEEASLFLVLNNMEQVKYINQFHVRVTKNDPVAVFLKKMVESHGWPMGPGSGKQYFNAAQSLERVYELDPKSDPTSAERAVATLAGAWGRTDSTMDGRLVEGLGRLYARHKTLIDTGSMIERLAKDARDPIQFIGAARTLHSLRRGSVVDAVAEQFTEVYNRGRREKSKIAPWRS